MSWTTYLADLPDAELKAFAVRLRTWMLRAESVPIPDQVCGLFVRLLANVHSEFGDRGWNAASDGKGPNIRPGQLWAIIHTAARRAVADTPTVSAAAVLAEVDELVGQVAAC